MRVHSGNHTIHIRTITQPLFTQLHNFFLNHATFISFLRIMHLIIISFSILCCRATFYEQNSAIHAFTHAHGPPSLNDPAHPVEKYG